MAARAHRIENGTSSRLTRLSFERAATHKERQPRGRTNGPSSQVTSAELLESCLNAHQESWVEFVKRFQPLIAIVIVKTLRRCIRPNPNLVDDLVQESYLKLCANNFTVLREFKWHHESALAGFLRVVASNVAQDYLRNLLCQKRGGGKGEDDLEQAVLWKESAVNSEEHIEREITLDQVQRCLESELAEPHLTRDCRIFWLYYRDGLTAKAISRQPGIGLSVKGVESALFRLTHLVRTKLGKPQRNNRRTERPSAKVAM